MTLQEFAHRLNMGYPTALKYMKLGIIKGQTIPPKSPTGRNSYDIPESEIEDFPIRVREYIEKEKQKFLK